MIRVLVVDDDFMVARVHRGLVERIPGFQVVGEARTGTDALRMIEQLRPALVLLDIYLPDMSGLDVVRRLRASPAAHTDVLIITAAREAETVRAALRGGAVNYIIKPFDSSLLRERLEQYAARQAELARIDAGDQDEVDRAFGGRAARQQMPKGLSAQTADLVRGALSGSGEGLSAAECAEQTGMSRVSARRYLEFFVDAQRAEVRLRYGTTGRPERRYHWLADT
ncbi:response regulator [Nocardioides sp.]|uniref:response regulator n=1 Tax=Nocardioides sp. TaxID=35761 RepID=UPI0027348FB1|nr:response regulator [Nocardioides sp.]MDP3890014.1 response regulator [Nocardioides sp.]